MTKDTKQLLQKEVAEMHWKHHLLGSIEVGIIVLNRNFQVMIWNEFMENHSGVAPSTIRDKVLFDHFPEINREWFARKSDVAFELNTPAYIIYEQRPYLMCFPSPRPVTSEDEFMYQNVTIFPLASLSNKIEHICVVIYDVSNEVASKRALAEANEKLQYLSQHDGMTGLSNRQHWEHSMQSEFARLKRTEQQACLLMMDIDKFKRINDTYGHSVGDEVIRAFAGVIKSCVRQTDIAGRYGGEEFAVILIDTSSDGAAYVAERIRKKFEKLTIDIEGQTITATASVGVAEYIPNFNSTVEWTNSADAALYEAKSNGRNQVVLARKS